MDQATGSSVVIPSVSRLPRRSFLRRLGGIPSITLSLRIEVHSTPPRPRSGRRLLLFPKFIFESIACSLDLRRLLAQAGSATKDEPFPVRFNDKRLGMFRPGRRKNFIGRPAHGDALQNFLELAFGIDVDRFFPDALKGSTRFA